MGDLEYSPVTGRPAPMAGAPPYPAHCQVTLANWQDAPYNRWAFQHVRELIPTARIARAARASELARLEQPLGEILLTLNGRQMSVEEHLATSYTDGFLVLRDGQVVAEQYRNGLTAETPHLLMSVSKSVVGAVAGVLAGRGDLDVTSRVSEIVPELGETSFAEASVRDLLDMRAGTRFSENYADPESDAKLCEEVYLWRPAGGALDVPDALCYFATLSNDGPHGGPFRYRSILTDVLAWVLERAAGERLATLISREIWQPMGAEFDADITVDGHGNALADGGMSATLRDVARFGQLFVPGAGGCVPSEWVADTIGGAADGAAAFVAGDNLPGYPAGAHYRNCWWVR
ncbi:MAG TPA: serine hydrolase, partial [Streptosporangiaceae bacterium]|nr:serine hydrolase [Streptosporangiaceae bacterium]